MSGITLSNEKETVEVSDDGGFFDSVVRPMLQSGHGVELHNWLQEMGLIKSSLSCAKPNCNKHKLTWKATRTVDKFLWKCSMCQTIYGVRNASFFHSVTCDIKIALKLILAWCQDIPPLTSALTLDTRVLHVKKVYKKCTKIANTWVMNHTDEFLLGGPGKVLVIYEHSGGKILPDANEIIQTKKYSKHKPTILCIVEANNIPPKMWFHVLQKMTHKNDDTIDNIKKDDNPCDEAIDVIKRHILPGSFIVANKNSTCRIFDAIVELKNYRVFSIDSLEQFDNDSQKLRDNLATIWQSAADISQDILDSPKSQRHLIISSYLWRQKFNFQNMLHQISEKYRFK